MVLIRHGESEFNVATRVQGRSELTRAEMSSRLTALGEQQARLVGAALQGIAVDAVLASPLLRARRTAELVTEVAGWRLGPELHSGLLEVDLAPWEGLTFAEVRDRFPLEYDAWHNRPHELAIAGRYPILELFEQARQFWAEVLPRHRDRTVVVAAHSGINRALICTAIGLAPEHYHYLGQNNCALSVVNFGDGQGMGQGQLEAVNLTGHMAPLMGEKLPSLRKNHVGPRLLLVRHGETQWNREKRFQGQIDIPLNERGRWQAEQVAHFLQDVPIDRAFSSPLLRPKATAEAILRFHPGVSLTLVKDLQEISHGRWEGKLEAEIEAEFPGELARWQTMPETVPMPDGETLNQVWERVAIAWQEMVAAVPPGQTAVVTAHDAVNKAILCQLFGLGPERFWTFKQGNGGVNVVDYVKGAGAPPYLTAANITRHLCDTVFDTTAAGAL
ncbi:MAG: histidine phosphatase family protein [Oscillatoriales cyanobacterium SM2_1_8]|nr:histidine phosphatase family protein [Oscillatoriales cyanobacterium SM2_1_8]